jgi:hypothetical protein
MKIVPIVSTGYRLRQCGRSLRNPYALIGGASCDHC